MSRFAAHVRIDLIEDQHWNLILGREHGLERQHHPRHFAGTGNGPQRSRRLAHIGRELELNFIQPA